MGWTLEHFQRGGLIGWLLPNSKAGIKTITRALGIDGVRLLAQNRYSTGYHALGWDVDVQGGVGNDELHDAVAAYVLAHWQPLGIRYMAWNGLEWLDSPRGPIMRKQPRDYGGNDPWHVNHVHLSFWPVEQRGKSEALLDLEAGTPTPAGPSPAVRAQLEALGFATVIDYQRAAGLVPDGDAGPITRATLEDDMTALADLTEDLGKAKSAIERNERRTEAILELLAALTKTIDDADLAGARRRAEQTNAAAGRIEREVGTYGQEAGA